MDNSNIEAAFEKRQEYAELAERLTGQSRMYTPGPTKTLFLEAKDAIETLTRALADMRRAGQ